MSLMTELRRRKVFRVAVVYAVTAWLLIQIVSEIEEPLGLPEWLDTFVIVILGIGFPVALILSWAFDVTPDGVAAASPSSQAVSVTAASTHWITHAGQLLILGAVGFLIADQYLFDGGSSAATTVAATGQAPRTVQRLSITLPVEHTIAFGWTTGMSLAISPDGRTIAYASSAWDDQGRIHHLAIRELGSREARMIPGSENGGLQPFFSPDGRWVAFFTADGFIRKAALAGGAAVTVARNVESSTWNSGVWTDSDEIFFTSREGDFGLVRVSADGGSLEPLPATRTLNDAAWWRPDFVPEANAIIVTAVNAGIAGPAVEAIFLETGDRKTIAAGATAARYAGPGRLVLQTGDVISLIAVDPVTLELLGDPVPIADTARRDGASASDGNFAQFDVADNGDLIYVPSGGTPSQLYRVDRRGNAQALDFSPDAYQWVDVSPDGRMLAVDVSSEAGDTTLLLDLQRMTRNPLPSPYQSNSGARWSPDGASLVTSSRTPESGRGLVEHALGGSSRVLALTREGDGGYRNVSWHPNGRELLFTWQTGLPHDIMTLTLSDEEAEPVPLIATPTVAEHTPSISPDGKWLAYVAGENVGIEQLYIRRYPDGIDVPVSREFAQGGVWARDSSELYFEGNYDGALMMLAVGVADSGSGAPELSAIEPLFPLRTRVGAASIETYLASGNWGQSFDVTSDGDFIMIRSEDQTRLQELVLVQNLDWPVP